MSRPHAGVELSAWALMAVPMGVLSGGVAGVIVNPVFGGAVPPWVLGLAVALLTGAGPVANLTSAFWAHASRGRARIGLIATLQAFFCVCLAAAAAMPITTLGLAGFVGLLLAAQTIWCGIITTRAHIWRQNYTREARTAFAARNQLVVSLIHAGIGAVTGWLIAREPQAFRILLLGAAACAAASIVRVRLLRLRGERRLLAAERRENAARLFDPRRFWAILTDDPLYRRYMTWMMVLGSGNLMFTAPLILSMTNDLGVPSATQVWITAALPTLIAPLATLYWARHLAREHVVTFRARNSRWYAASVILFALAAIGGQIPLLWLASAALGVGIGGGVLGWNLGHNDFAPDEKVSEYVGLHVSLTGVRGLLAPLTGVALYGLIEARAPGAGAWSLLLPALLTSCGAIGFHRFRRSLARQPHQFAGRVR